MSTATAPQQLDRETFEATVREARAVVNENLKDICTADTLGLCVLALLCLFNSDGYSACLGFFLAALFFYLTTQKLVKYSESTKIQFTVLFLLMLWGGYCLWLLDDIAVITKYPVCYSVATGIYFCAFFYCLFQYYRKKFSLRLTLLKIAVITYAYFLVFLGKVPLFILFYFVIVWWCKKQCVKISSRTDITTLVDNCSRLTGGRAQWNEIATLTFGIISVAFILSDPELELDISDSLNCIAFYTIFFSVEFQEYRVYYIDNLINRLTKEYSDVTRI